MALCAMQCAPKPKTFSYPVGSDGTCKTLHVNLRSIYRAPEGWSFLSADYCQMELRIMAHLAEESHLISAFNTVGPSGSHGQGIDPFTILAEQMDQKRADVKQLFYAVSYGMGSEQLSKKLGCDSNTAKKWKAELLSKFPKVWMLSDVYRVCLRVNYWLGLRWCPASSRHEGLSLFVVYVANVCSCYKCWERLL